MRPLSFPIMVVEEGRTSMKDVKKALEMLPQEKFLGFVLNRQTGALGDKYYGYYKWVGLDGLERYVRLDR